MLSPDDIQYQQELLATHRGRLAVLLQQQATFGTTYTPPGVITDIAAARVEIQRIKAILRANDITVDDMPNDDPAPVNDPTKTPELNTDQQLARYAESGNTQTGGVNFGTSNRIDNIGDVVGRDKIEGDKVEGNKINDNRRGFFWNQVRVPMLVVIAVILIFLAASIVTAGANVLGFKATLQYMSLLPRDPTPAPTAEPLLFSPEQLDETLIIVVPFFRTEGVIDTDEAHIIQHHIQQDIQTQGIAHVRVEVADGKHVRAEDRAGVTAFAQRYHASMVIWGSNTGVEVLVNYLNLRQPDFAAADVLVPQTGREGKTQLANPQAYAGFITQDLPSIMTFLSLFAVGQSAFARQDYPTATSIISASLDVLNEVTPLPEGTADAYLDLGWLYQVSDHNTSRAEVAYTRAISLDPTYADAYNNRGNVYYDQKQLDKALADYDKAISLDPTYAGAYNNRGVVYDDQKQLDKALADYNSSA